MLRSTYLVALPAIALGLVACGAGSTPPDAGARASPAPRAIAVIDLPAPHTDGDASLEAAILARRSARSFTDEGLTLAQISQLLWAAQGITADWGGRAAPSAGALYPLEVYLVMADGLYHYVPASHSAELLSRADLRAPLQRAALGQTAIVDAPAVFVITAVYVRTTQRYGDRGERYVHLEAGHAAQNLLLQATALGLAGVPIGAFSDGAVGRVLDLPRERAPLYLIPIGRSAEGTASP